MDQILRVLATKPRATFDIADVALQIAKDEYPQLDVSVPLAQIRQLAFQVQPRIRGTLEERVGRLCEFLFEQQGFSGDHANYYDPRNSYLSDVLDRRKGIPISLSVLVMGIGDRLGLKIAGIGLPAHFIVKAIEEGDEVLFDPYNGGQILTPDSCQALVKRVSGQDVEINAGMLQPLPLGWIVMRMLNNLKMNYLEMGDYPRAIRVMNRLIVLTGNDIIQQRDLGIAYFRADRPGLAIGYLKNYLQKNSDANDAAAIRDLLEMSLSEVSRWN